MLSPRSIALIAKAKRVIAEVDAMLAEAGFNPKAWMSSDDKLASPWFLPDPTLPPDEFAAVQQRHRQVMQKRYSDEQLSMISEQKRSAWQRSKDEKPVCIHRLIAAGPGNFGMSERYAAAIRQWAGTKDAPRRQRAN